MIKIRIWLGRALNDLREFVEDTNEVANWWKANKRDANKRDAKHWLEKPIRLAHLCLTDEAVCIGRSKPVNYTSNERAEQPKQFPVLSSSKESCLE